MGSHKNDQPDFPEPISVELNKILATRAVAKIIDAFLKIDDFKDPPVTLLTAAMRLSYPSHQAPDNTPANQIIGIEGLDETRI